MEEIKKDDERALKTFMNLHGMGRRE